MAAPEGLEPPTLGSEDRCSIQLSYGALLSESLSSFARLDSRGGCPHTFAVKKMGWETGIEPATAGATVQCSAS